MRDRLPCIHIKVGDSLRFLERFGEIAEQGGTYTVRRFPRCAGGTITIIIGFQISNSSLTDIKAHLTFYPETPGRVSVEIRGDFSEDWPSYEAYRTAAITIVEPVLTAFNRLEHTRYRMAVKSKEKLVPKLSFRSDQFFKHFIRNANTSQLHYIDWRRFYKFVRVNKARVSEVDLHYLLVTNGFSEQCAEEIVIIYGHLRDFMEPPSCKDILESYHVRKGSP